MKSAIPIIIGIVIAGLIFFFWVFRQAGKEGYTKPGKKIYWGRRK